MHGDMNQDARSKMMDRFRKQRVRCLVATDVVGRGIDVTGISHIINYDIPQFSDDYVHRVGRTGRMGREGVAFTFVTPEEGNELTRIEMRIDRLLQRDSIDAMGAKAPAASMSRAGPSGEEAAAEPPAPEPAAAEPPREPLYGRGGRPKRKHRRAL
jgi:ATP-dependent RNA helicase DeaD